MNALALAVVGCALFALIIVMHVLGLISENHPDDDDAAGAIEGAGVHGGDLADGGGGVYQEACLTSVVNADRPDLGRL